MDYAIMWNELKEFIGYKRQTEYDDIPQYIYESIQDKMDDIESEYTNPIKRGDYICIKHYGDVFLKGLECNILTEHETTYVAEVCNGNVGVINKTDFDEYFKYIRE